ncbi:MAG: hypothetical protein KAH18_00180 [Psychromonas sp.]|nr:hypothetical protein [Psychromonas sp.]
MPKAWGENTVVCDPWYNEWFVGNADWMRKLRQIIRYSDKKIIFETAKIWLRIKYFI